MSDIQVLKVYPVIIVGGGIAGLTAANYLCQANIPNILIEGNKPGGALSQSDSVRNWPGILETPGKDLVLSMKKQVYHNGTSIEGSKVIDINLKKEIFKIKVKNITTGKKETLCTKSLIIGMGCNPRYLGIDGEEKYWGGTKGVSNCAVCEGNLYKNKIVGVVGGGDSAIEEASYLSDIAKEVHIFVRKDFFRANDKKKKDITIEKKNVNVHFNTEVKEIIGDENKMIKVKLLNNLLENEEEKFKDMELDGLFYGIGSDPNTELLKNQLELTEDGFVELKNHQETSVKGVYAVGDISDPLFKQAITSAGDGCKAALQVQKYLQEIEFDYTSISVEDRKQKYPELEYEKKEKKEKKTKKSKKVKKNKETLNETLVVPGEVYNLETSEDLMTIIKQNENIVLDLYADWCGPCMMMKPFFHESARKYQNIAFVAINTDYHNELASRLSVNSLPTILFIKNQYTKYRLEGFNKEEFINYLDKMSS
jgi:thioredoxin reductase (NADPH)